jgi:thiamine-monophosphate kinase
MIDLSDGLSSDLGHILDESARRLGRRMGATLDEAALESLPGLAAAARELGVSPVEACIAGGDDYELLFTAPPARGRNATARKLSRRLGLSILRIGEITREPGLRIETCGGRTRRVRRIRRCGWEHF